MVIAIQPPSNNNLRPNYFTFNPVPTQTVGQLAGFFDVNQNGRLNLGESLVGFQLLDSLGFQQFGSAFKNIFLGLLYKDRNVDANGDGQFSYRSVSPVTPLSLPEQSELTRVASGDGNSRNLSFFDFSRLVF